MSSNPADPVAVVAAAGRGDNATARSAESGPDLIVCSSSPTPATPANAAPFSGFLITLRSIGIAGIAAITAGAHRGAGGHREM